MDTATKVAAGQHSVVCVVGATSPKLHIRLRLRKMLVSKESGGLLLL